MDNPAQKGERPAEVAPQDLGLASRFLLVEPLRSGCCPRT